MKKLFLVLVLLVMLISFSCTKQNKTIKDMVNREVAIKDDAEKVVCLIPGLVEWINKLSLQDRLVGIGTDCKGIEGTEKVPVVGSFFGLDTNALKEIKPDYVFAMTTLDKDLWQWLKDNDISLVLFAYPTKIEDTYKALNLMGEIFGEKEKTDKAIKEYQQQIKAITAQNTTQKPKGYFSIRFNDRLGEDVVASGSHIIGNLMELSGIDNVAKNNGDMIFHRDSIVNADPEYIFMDEKMIEAFANTPPYSSLSATKNNKLVGVDMNLLTAYTPKYIIAIKIMSSAVK